MEIAIIEDEILYDGSEIRPLWAFKQFGILGTSGIAWRGPMNIKPEYMCDLKDLKEGKEIKGDDLIHFRLEFFDNPDIRLAYYRQRLFAAVATEYFGKKWNLKLRRRGSDLFYEDKKLTVSVATTSSTSSIIHFAINITSRGTPKEAKTIGLQDLGFHQSILDTRQWRTFAKAILYHFKRELKDIEDDLAKTEVII